MKARNHPFVLALLAGIIAVLNGRAADHTVHMTSDYQFSPAYLEIQAGDTVTWINDDDTFTHNAASDTGLWNTGDVDFGSSATLQFNLPANYPYRDSLFYPSGMTGTLVVDPVSVPPPPALIILPAILTGGSFRFTITNLTVGKTNVIEISTNLFQWTPIATNIPAGNALDFTNPPANGLRFFRSWQAP